MPRQRPSVFRLELSSDTATREQIVAKLKELIWHIECLDRGVTGIGLFRENWSCEAVAPLRATPIRTEEK